MDFGFNLCFWFFYFSLCLWHFGSSLSSSILVPTCDFWILVPSIENEKFVHVSCAFSSVVMWNLFLALVMSLPLLIVDSSPLKVVVS